MLNDPTGHIPCWDGDYCPYTRPHPNVPPEEGGGGDKPEKRTVVDDIFDVPEVYTNNMGLAWRIVTNGSTTFDQRLQASAYLVFGVGAPVALVAGVTVLAAKEVGAVGAWCATAGGCEKSADAAFKTVEAAKPALENFEDDIIHLYRVVGDAELLDIMENQIFRGDPNGKSMDAKWFWKSLDAAEGFSEVFPGNIVDVTIPQKILDYASEGWENLDRLGPAVGFVEGGLDELNRAITSITQIK